MRLHNGQVGRVQSLSASPQPSADSDEFVHPSSPCDSSQTQNSGRRLSQYHARGEGSSRRGGRSALQNDYRQDPIPFESRSLADYIRFPSSPKHASASSTVVEPALQVQMESEFPKLDSALIAAIVADYSDPTEARGVLSALS